jgi:hypothetical protein
MGLHGYGVLCFIFRLSSPSVSDSYDTSHHDRMFMRNRKPSCFLVGSQRYAVLVSILMSDQAICSLIHYHVDSDQPPILIFYAAAFTPSTY